MSIMAEKKVETSFSSVTHDEERQGIQLAGALEEVAVDPALNKALFRKQDRHILPLCAGIYLLCYLDRSNIGNAKILNAGTNNDLLQETHMTDHQYIIALMVFLIAYTIFEVPSNVLLKKLSPSMDFVFDVLMERHHYRTWRNSEFCWSYRRKISPGRFRSGSATLNTSAKLSLTAEGLFPGLVYYLTFWYRPEERSLRVAIILASATLAGAFGGAITYGVGHMNGTSGVAAWRWLFILEGLPSCISSVLGFFLLPDYPETAKWLNDAERATAIERLKIYGSKGLGTNVTWKDAKETLTQWRLYVHYAIYVGISCPFSSLSLFAPTIVDGLGYTSLRANLMTVPPYAAAYVVTLLVAFSADHFNARGIHSAAFSLIGACGFLASALLPADASSSRYGCLIVAACGEFACIPPLLEWLSTNVQSTAAAGIAIAMNVSFGAPGQIIGVWIYKASEKKKGYPIGHGTNAGMLLFVCIGCTALTAYYRRSNTRIMQPGSGAKFYSY